MLAGRSKAGPVVGPHLDEVVGVGQHVLQARLVHGGRDEDPVGPGLCVVVLPPVLHLATAGTRYHRDVRLSEAASAKRFALAKS